MTTYAAQIDDLLDLWDGALPGFDAFTAREVAGELTTQGTPCSVPHASMMLQSHRLAQKTGRTRWVLGCRGYARTAEWYVLAGPGRAVGGAQRLSLGHAMHIARDLSKRAESDILTELEPSAAAHPAVQAMLSGFSKQIEANAAGLVAAVNVSLDLIEATTGLVADRRGVAP